MWWPGRSTSVHWPFVDWDGRGRGVSDTGGFGHRNGVIDRWSKRGRVTGGGVRLDDFREWVRPFVGGGPEERRCDLDRWVKGTTVVFLGTSTFRVGSWELLVKVLTPATRILFLV